MPVARTVLGDVPAEKLGVTFTHEHITFSWASARGDLAEHYDPEGVVKRIAASVAAAKRDYNVNTLVCVSTSEMGRDVDIYAEVSRRTGVNIIASTGSYQQNAGLHHYWSARYWDREEHIQLIEEYLTKEIAVGVGRNNIKCGNIKLAWNRYTPTEVEERICRASGRVSGKLNIPIALHCIYRGAPPDVNPGVHMIDILTSEGTKPSKIKIDHHMSTGGNLVPLLEVLRRGAYLGFETLSTSEEAVTRLTTTIGGLIAAGYVSQLLLCPQTIAPGWINVQPPWNVKNWNQDHSYLHREILPRMRKGGVTEKDIEQLLVVNPKNFLCF